MDNLNIHSPSSLYVAFDPKEAKRLADKLEVHYTPVHGSWLNMAEIELAILSGQCLDREVAMRAPLTVHARYAGTHGSKVGGDLHILPGPCSCDRHESDHRLNREALNRTSSGSALPSTDASVTERRSFQHDRSECAHY
jgi:DDE superfamily endonuclease